MKPVVEPKRSATHNAEANHSSVVVQDSKYECESRKRRFTTCLSVLSVGNNNLLLHYYYIPSTLIEAFEVGNGMQRRATMMVQ